MIRVCRMDWERFPGQRTIRCLGRRLPTGACRSSTWTDSFTASVTYDLPFGKGKHFGSNWNGATNAVLGNWEVDVIQRATSGFPLFVVDSSNSSGVSFSWNGNNLHRPDEVGDPNRGGPVAANPTCAAPATVHTLETLVQPVRVRTCCRGRAWQLQARAHVRPEFRQYGPFFYQGLPVERKHAAGLPR